MSEATECRREANFSRDTINITAAAGKIRR
jgi:hypothetical protein